MKDIFFGCSKKVVRYAYLRRDVENMKKLYNDINESKLIIFKKDENTNRLEVLINKDENKLELVDLIKYNELKELIKNWLNYNIEIEKIVNEKSNLFEYSKLNFDLKNNSIFWLGYDDLNCLSINNKDLKLENKPIYALDISKSLKFLKFINNNIINKEIKFTENMNEILKMNNENATTYSYSKTFIDFINKNNFCPSCAGHVLPVQLGSRLYCLNDSPFNDLNGNCKINLRPNNLQFPRTDPCIIISLYDESGRILLGSNLKRHPVIKENKDNNDKSIELTKKFYSCFAGFMEPGETIEQCCIREVYEETGLKIKTNDIKIIESQPWPFPSNLMIGCIGFVNKEESYDSKININLDKELDDVRWFNSIDVDNVLNNKKDGILSKSNNLIEQWYCPPKESIAGRLIQHCVDKSNNFEGKF
ncbi:NADH pyrophosphatase [Pichia californica]|uniref:NAD(+) diphosphatase n=1 Tax=Pichia californica TaxID=460514 RepID=A0A9P7BD59_9ASCO|nr:NADH pyrophosphatase [[Candida] californica]KAG0686536.1 NADH pyrophosphatase [[Candida] californica]